MTATLKLFNTLSREIEPFEPRLPGEVRFYTCGPTVYARVHIGNLRAFLVEDLLRRTLRFFGWRTTQVMNLTDVDDKTIAGAREAGVELSEFTQPYIDGFFRDLDTLRIERAEHYPRATESIQPMLDLVQRLFERGYAYELDGSVYFRIAADEDYGRLSRLDPTQLQQGDRVAGDEYGKEDARDFVLWKAAKPGEPSWDSPWGPGRPGWHLECSAMSMRLLGESFDLHAGGVDLIFPHHENEIAQSESATGRPLARCWLHAEHLIVDGEKMSKSLGNQYTLPQLIAQGAEPRALRYLLASVNYRQKLNFTFEALEAAAAALRRIDEMQFRLEHASGDDGLEFEERIQEFRQEFAAALGEDLNISAALAAVHGLVREVNAAVEESRVGAQVREGITDALAEADQVLAVLDPQPWRGADGASEQDDGEIEGLVAQREEARQSGEYDEADRLRQRLEELGVRVEDTPQGPRWKRR